MLMALLESSKHGYEVAKFIEEKSNGFFRMPFGTLYPILHRLEKEGFVKVKFDDKDTLKAKKVYTLTKKGNALCKDEVADFNLFSLAIKKMVPT